MLVVTRELVDPERTVPLLRLAPKGTTPGVVDRNHGEAGLAPYRPIEQVALPGPGAYLLLDVDRGEEFLGVRPEEALPVILGRGRTPLTIEEGIAVVTHAPQRAGEEPVLHAVRVSPRRPPGAGDVDLGEGAQARLVLGRQPPRLARGGLGGRPRRLRHRRRMPGPAPAVASPPAREAH